MTYEIRNASPVDWPKVESLLREAELPLDGARDHLDDFLVCHDDGAVVGAAGLEVYGRVALLRSVVVAVGDRGHGVGKELVRRVLARARERGAREVVLLTTTAADYFPRFGFRRIDRAAVPPEAEPSAELRGACPDTAVVMLATL